MIRVYDSVLNEDLIEGILNYFESVSENDVWSSTLRWQEDLTSKSSNVITHKIRDKNLCNKIKNIIENKININFDEENLSFCPMIYIWSPNSYISWHDDKMYPYNGTIYLNEEWNSNDGGIFLYKDNKTKSIIGIEPTYNSMVVNSSTTSDPHNFHCVTCIPSSVSKRRITIQWRTRPSKNAKLSYQ